MFTAMPTDSANGGGSSSRIQASPGLSETRFRSVQWVHRTASTNSDVLRKARDGAPEGTVVVADHQDAGRGRRGRSWVDLPESSLLVSVLLRPPAPLAPMTTLAVGVALAEAVEREAGFTPGLKWPNDLVVAGTDGDRKLAGILAETDWPPGATIAAGWREPADYERVAVVAGVGVNVSWPERDANFLPADVVDTATAINWVVGRDIDRGDLLVAFLTCLEAHYEAMVRERSPEAVLAAWKERSATLGRRVRVDLGADDVEGTAVDVTDRGHLVLETLDGARRSLAVGDIVHLRSR